MKHFRKASFNANIKITQNEIVKKLDDLDAKLINTLLLLLKYSNAIKFILLPKLIKSFPEKKKIIVRCKQKKQVLNTCAILSHSILTKQNIKKIAKLLINLNLPRYIMYEILDQFIIETEGYIKLTYDYTRIGNKIRSNDFTNDQALYYSNISQQMLDIEDSVNANRSHLYSLIKQSKSVINQYIKIRNKILLSNLSLCYTTSSNLSNNSSDFQDNYQDCTFGILRAFELYETNRSVPFDNYALIWASQPIRENYNTSKKQPNFKNIGKKEEEEISAEFFEDIGMDINPYFEQLSKPEQTVIAMVYGMYNYLPEKEKISEQAIIFEKLRQQKRN